MFFFSEGIQGLQVVKFWRLKDPCSNSFNWDSTDLIPWQLDHWGVQTLPLALRLLSNATISFTKKYRSLYFTSLPCKLEDFSCAPNMHTSTTKIPEEEAFISVENRMSFWGYYSFETHLNWTPLLSLLKEITHHSFHLLVHSWESARFLFISQGKASQEYPIAQLSHCWLLSALNSCKPDKCCMYQFKIIGHILRQIGKELTPHTDNHINLNKATFNLELSS